MMSNFGKMHDDTLILPTVPDKALDNGDFFTKLFQNDINGLINGDVQPSDRRICKRRPSFGSEAFSPNKRRGRSAFYDDEFSRDHSSDPSRDIPEKCLRRECSSTEECTKECKDLYSQETKDRISHLTDVYTQEIIDHVERSTCTEQIQSQLPAILSRLCHELVGDEYNLGKRIDHLMHEKSALCNIIKSQYETISRLRDVEITAVRSAQEGQAYKAELARLREMVSGCSPRGAFSDELDHFRKPPDVC